jgi:hypothetical protein
MKSWTCSRVSRDCTDLLWYSSKLLSIATLQVLFSFRYSLISAFFSLIIASTCSLPAAVFPLLSVDGPSADPSMKSYRSSADEKFIKSFFHVSKLSSAGEDSFPAGSSPHVENEFRIKVLYLEICEVQSFGLCVAECGPRPHSLLTGSRTIH